MNLIQIRTKFRDISGRFDLVNDDLSDNGADFFINEGRKFLDRLDETQKSWATKLCPLAVGELSVSFPYCRAIKEVWVAGAIDGRWQLEKKPLQDLVDGYLSGLPSEFINGIPLFYSPCITRPMVDTKVIGTDGLIYTCILDHTSSAANKPITGVNYATYWELKGTSGSVWVTGTAYKKVATQSFESFLGFAEVPSSGAGNYNAILLNVPTDKALTVIIHGLFYSPELTLDTDTNYWSEVHPMLLIYAAMRQSEIINRNMQGAADWTNTISLEMRQLGYDLVEELISGVSQIND